MTVWESGGEYAVRREAVSFPDSQNMIENRNCLRRRLAWTGTRLSQLFERKTAQKEDFSEFLCPVRTAGAKTDFYVLL